MCVACPDRAGEPPLRPGLQADRQRHAGQHPGPAGAGGVQGDTCPAAETRELTRVHVQAVRAGLIDVVLATDMSKHFLHVNKFRSVT